MTGTIESVTALVAAIETINARLAEEGLGEWAAYVRTSGGVFFHEVGRVVEASNADFVPFAIMATVEYAGDDLDELVENVRTAEDYIIATT